MREMKERAIVCNIGHFDSEIQVEALKNYKWHNVKPQVDEVEFPDGKRIILLAEGRLVNLGNATGHPSRIMDGSFANQVLAQMYLYERKFADLDAESKTSALVVEVLPKHLDEEVASDMVSGFGGVLTKLTQEQADYIGVSMDGPFKPESYKY